MANVIEIEGLRKCYRRRRGTTVAVDGLDLAVPAGGVFGFLGPNGSGKTTMINCISGALDCTEGSIMFEGLEINSLPAYQRAKLGISRSFQIPRPFKTMTVLENICVPLDFAAWDRTGHRDIRDQAMEILESIGIADRASELSANLTQVDLRKLELARAMAAKPKLLVSDEAMAGLSSAEVDEILEILMVLNDAGVAVIMIEHIMRAVMRYSRRIVVLDAGKKIADGAPDDVIHNPEVERAYLGE